MIVLVLFGRGRISEMMGDVGKGIKSFRKGLGGEGEAPLIDGPVHDVTPVSEAVSEPRPAAD